MGLQLSGLPFQSINLIQALSFEFGNLVRHIFRRLRKYIDNEQELVVTAKQPIDISPSQRYMLGTFLCKFLNVTLVDNPLTRPDSKPLMFDSSLVLVLLSVEGLLMHLTVACSSVMDIEYI